MSSKNVTILSLLFCIGRRMRDERHAYSMLHFHTLRYVQKEGRPFMHDVARYLRVTPPAATLLIDGLVKDKLLARSFDKKDRRAVRVTLTARGKAFLAQGIRNKMVRLKKMFAVLTPKERAMFVAILQKITRENL
ncbi:MAG: MarR family transcriptional regulator [Minisyncoccia bacterium]|jgi:DNA-binding MarR family transcriptional regulator